MTNLYLPGACLIKNRWRGSVCVFGRKIHVGTFTSEGQAYEACQETKLFLAEFKADADELHLSEEAYQAHTEYALEVFLEDQRNVWKSDEVLAIEETQHVKQPAFRAYPRGIRPTKNRFSASLKIFGKHEYLGSFSTIEAAHKAHIEAFNFYQIARKQGIEGCEKMANYLEYKRKVYKQATIIECPPDPEKLLKNLFVNRSPIKS